MIPFVSVKRLKLKRGYTKAEYLAALREFLKNNPQDLKRYASSLKSKAKKDLKEKYKKLKKADEYKNLEKKAWKLVSVYVRQLGSRNGMNTCFTCGVLKPWKELQAGHYKHGRLDYDPDNLKPQCVKCNSYLSGNMNQYRKRLVEIHGEKWIEDLELRANQYHKPSKEELHSIIEKYTPKP